MLIDEYRNIRATINHDFLKNRYLTFLTARKDDLKSLINTEYIKTRVIEWRQYSVIFVNFADKLEMYLSPIQLFQEPPLNNFPVDEQEWMKQICHESYCEISNIRAKSKKLTHLINEITSLVDEIYNNEICIANMNALYELCKRLSTEISKLPTTIKLP